MNIYIEEMTSICLSNKYAQWYFNIINNARIRATSRKEAKEKCGYVEEHHIIPESFYITRKRAGTPGWLNGTPVNQQNIAYLTGREHFICHRLLLKILTGIGLEKMKKAFITMCYMKNQNQQRYQISSQTYELARKLKSESMSVYNKNRGPISNSTRLKISISSKRKRNPMSDETKAKISVAQTGKRASEETRAKLRVSAKNCLPDSPETKAKRIASNTGQHRSDETRANISNSLKGKPSYVRTDEHKLKMSISCKNKNISIKNHLDL